MAIKRVLFAWYFLTLLIAASLLGIWLWHGADGFEIVIQRGPYTNLPVTLASVVFTWLLGGLFLHLLSSNRINNQNGLAWAGFFLIALVYLNLLRERPEYGDVEYYIDAALKLSEGKGLPNEYFYPPVWATLLAWLAPMGKVGIFISIWLFNLLGLFIFYFLLYKTLQRYDFSSNFASLVVTGFMLVNAPLLRTMVYMQINLHVMNAIFLGLLLYPRFPVLSALAMAVAVHLKASPAVLILAFLLEWNWRWLAWAALAFIIVGAIPVVAYGVAPYSDFLQNTLGLVSGHALNFREHSFEGLLMALAAVLDLPTTFVRIGTNIARAILFIVVMLVMRKNIQHETFSSGQGVRLYNSMPSLLILMMMASPIVWVHHGVIVGLSFLLLLKKLDSPIQWTFFGLAYFLEYLLPTFDFFPWSYVRLFAPMICLWLLWTLSEGSDERFVITNQWSNKLLIDQR